MTSSISVEPYETVEFSDSDTDSWQVVDPFDSDNDDVITTESDVVSSSDEGDDVDDEEEDEDEDVGIDDVIASESDVISSEDEDEEEEDEDEDDVITSEEEEEDEDDDVIISEDEEDDVDEIANHTQELNKGYELDRLINGEGGAPYNVEISDVMKEDAYFEHMQLQPMLDEDDVEEQEEEDEDEDEYDEDLDDELVPRWLNNKFERQRMRKLGKKVYPKMKKSKRMVNQYNRPGCAGAKHGLGLNNNLVW